MPDGSLRVAIFAESYLPYLSGVTVATDALARGLATAGHRVLVVAPRPLGGPVDGDSSAGAEGPNLAHAWLPSYQLPVVVPPGYRMPWPRSSSALRVATAFRPQVVHAQSPFVSGLMARRVARRVGAPLIFTHHTRFSDYRHYLGLLAVPGAALTDRHLRRFWESCAAIVAPSRELAAEISDRLSGSRSPPIVRVVPTGLDLPSIAALEAIDPRPLAGWPAGTSVIASLGRLAPEKSIEVVVDAFAALRPADHVRLLLIGGGPSEAALRRRAAAGDLAGRVHLTGPLPRERALAMLKGADVFAFASRTETQGLVLAEALACGVPVVALPGPGVVDSVRDGEDGVVVDAAQGDRSDALARALDDLLRDDARRRRLASAAAAGSVRFDLRRRIAEVEHLYREAVARRAGSTLTP
jgi:1,2-diacylglycerol 3-alpha-glucosyltransferase